MILLVYVSEYVDNLITLNLTLFYFILNHNYNLMLSSLLFKRIANFSRLYSQPSILDYPINRNDELHSKNRILMGETNNHYSAILKKVSRY